MRAQANKHRKERYFVVGDFVFLKLKQNRQQSVMNRVNPKLSAKYYGPSEVVEKIGVVETSPPNLARENPWSGLWLEQELHLGLNSLRLFVFCFPKRFL